jgi:hypothetical protein
MVDAEIISLLERATVALERLADHFSPAEVPREKQPAKLSTAIYKREEREQEELRKTLKGTTLKP